MRKYWNFNKGIRQLENWESGCWIQVTCPVENDVKYLSIFHIIDSNDNGLPKWLKR